ncbi:hypothetical protein ACLOJK_031720 [Asimina triloba]
MRHKKLERKLKRQRDDGWRVLTSRSKYTLSPSVSSTFRKAGKALFSLRTEGETMAIQAAMNIHHRSIASSPASFSVPSFSFLKFYGRVEFLHKTKEEKGIAGIGSVRASSSPSSASSASPWRDWLKPQAPAPSLSDVVWPSAGTRALARSILSQCFFFARFTADALAPLIPNPTVPPIPQPPSIPMISLSLSL